LNIFFLDSSSINELLLVYRKFGIYVNYLTGIRTRHRELMWSALPNTTSYCDPYLLIYTEKSIDIYNVLSGIWLQSFPLSNTYPLTFDGSISVSYDPELDKHHAKLISITEENRLTLSLNLLEKSSPKTSTARDGLFRNPFFSSMKSTQSFPNISISEPTGFRHVEHLGRDDGLTILSSSTHDQQNNGRKSTIRPYASQFSDENGTKTDSSFNSILDASFPPRYTVP